jgi:hypothetical protein
MIKFDTKLQGLKALKSPPKVKNPSLISQKGKQKHGKVSLAKIGPKVDRERK